MVTINVLDFGAVPDARYYNTLDGQYYQDAEFTRLPTDNTDAFREALLNAVGKTLFVPAGRYMILGTLVVGSSTKMKGAGFDHTHIYVGDDFDLDSTLFRETDIQPIILTEAGSGDITFESFKLHGNRNRVIRSGWGVAGILAKETERVKFLGMDVSWINTLRSMTGSTSSGQGWAITSMDAHDVEFFQSRSEYGGYQNFGFFDRTTKGLMHECFSGMGRRTSVQVHRDTDDIKIIRNTIKQEKSVFFEEPHAALTVHGEAGEEARNVTIENNDIYINEAFKAGIQAFRGSENLIVRKNNIQSNAEGINLGDADDALVENNKIKWLDDPIPDGEGLFLGKYGISLTLNVRNSTIRNNEISGFQQNIYQDNTIGDTNVLYGNHPNSAGVRKARLYTKKNGKVLRVEPVFLDNDVVKRVVPTVRL